MIFLRHDYILKSYLLKKQLNWQRKRQKLCSKSSSITILLANNQINHSFDTCSIIFLQKGKSQAKHLKVIQKQLYFQHKRTGSLKFYYMPKFSAAVWLWNMKQSLAKISEKPDNAVTNHLSIVHKILNYKLSIVTALSK